MLIHFVQSIINFRMGTRRNNVQLVDAAKYKGGLLSHGRSHGIYHKIEVFDTIYRYVMPHELRQL